MTGISQIHGLTPFPWASSHGLGVTVLKAESRSSSEALLERLGTGFLGEKLNYP
jgi:hypothetical protein